MEVASGIRSPRDSVVDLLAVVRALLEQKRPIAEPKEVGMFRNGTTASSWDQHDSLCNYLLLTCFDVLGQQAPFVDFQQWLRSGKLEAERQSAVASLPPGLNPVETCLALYTLYNERYSVTKGFFRFIDGVLTADARKALLDSVAIARVPEVDEAKEEKLKKRFLYRFRNDYTHGAIAPMTVSRGEDGSRMELLRIGEPSRRHGPTFRFVGGDIEGEGIVWVSDWPHVLFRTVAGVVDEPVPEFETTHTLRIFFEDGALVTVPEVQGQDFKDPAKRKQLIDDVTRKVKTLRESKRENEE
jgi:hypothetical protein